MSDIPTPSVQPDLSGQGALAGESEPRPVQALVRVAVPMRKAEREQLMALLRERLGREVEYDIVVDPEILGGVWVRVGDTVIDGSVRGKMEELRHHLRTQCRFMITNRFGATQRPLMEQPGSMVAVELPPASLQDIESPRD